MVRVIALALSNLTQTARLCFYALTGEPPVLRIYDLFFGAIFSNAKVLSIAKVRKVSELIDFRFQ